MSSQVIDTIKSTVSSNVRELSRGGQVLKKILLVSNTLVLLFGLLLIIVGGVAAGGQFDGLSSTTLASGIIVIGFLVMIVALLGCWGAMVENKRLLYIYFALLLFFAIVEFAVGIAAYVRKDDLPDLESTAWSTLYNTDKKSIDDLEKNFKCCGWYNVTDRSTPPLGTEDTCHSLYPSNGACSSYYYTVLGLEYGSDPNDATQRKDLEDYQVVNRCCGWTQLVETNNYWVPLRINSTQTCVSTYGFTQTCFAANQAKWYNYYNMKSPEGDNGILGMQQQFKVPGQIGSTCCGWLTDTDRAVPLYSNTTCLQTKGFETDCKTSMETALLNSLQITGGVGIALGILEVFTIIIVIVLIVKIPNKGGRARNDIAEGVMAEELHDEE